MMQEKLLQDMYTIMNPKAMVESVKLVSGCKNASIENQKRRLTFRLQGIVITGSTSRKLSFKVKFAV